MVSPDATVRMFAEMVQQVHLEDLPPLWPPLWQIRLMPRNRVVPNTESILLFPQTPSGTPPRLRSRGQGQRIGEAGVMHHSVVILPRLARPTPVDLGTMEAESEAASRAAPSTSYPLAGYPRSDNHSASALGKCLSGPEPMVVEKGGSHSRCSECFVPTGRLSQE